MRRDREMLARVGEHVDERIADLGRCRELAAMVAVAPKTAATAEARVRAAREADDGAAKSPRERVVVARFDDEMDVIGLNRKMDDLKVVATRVGEHVA
ncbi:MAG TPA: hypothetical protein VIF62_00970 [Labilithrix sp.]